jgi:hypothetical protein
VLTVALVAACVVAGYLVGRARPGGWLLGWAEDQDGHRRWYDPRLWLALPILAVALAWMLTVHPRRSAENRRAWREDRREPAPVMDPNWAAKHNEEAS